MNKILKLLISVYVIIMSSSIVHSSENFFDEAMTMYQDEKYEEARFLFERNIVYNPKDAKTYLYLAKIYNHEENQRQEENNLTTALLIEPNNEEVLLMLMKIALKKSNYAKVKDLSQTFVKVCDKLCDENNEIQKSLKNIEPEKIETSTLKTLQERLDLFIRVLDNKPKEVVNKLISCIQNLKVKSFDSLKVQAIIDNGAINFNSLEKTESSYFDSKNNELTLTRPISKTYVKILKPILYSLITKTDDNELRSLLSTFASICDKDYLVAESYLDDLDFKKLEEIEADELIHESGKYDYIPDEIQSDGSEEEGDFTEITHGSNQDFNEDPIDDLLETNSSKEEVDDLPDTISISENEESNSQNKENDREKERRNPREFKNEGDSAGIANCYISLGYTYRQLADKNQELEYNRKSFEIFKRLGSPERIGVTSHNLGESYYNIGNYEKSEELTLLAIHINDSIQKLTVKEVLNTLHKII